MVSAQSVTIVQKGRQRQFSALKVHTDQQKVLQDQVIAPNVTRDITAKALVSLLQQQNVMLDGIAQRVAMIQLQAIIRVGRVTFVRLALHFQIHVPLVVASFNMRLFVTYFHLFIKPYLSICGQFTFTTFSDLKLFIWYISCHRILKLSLLFGMYKVHVRA